VNDLDRDLEMPPYDNKSKSSYSREYKNYKEEERIEREETRYEKLCQKMASIFNLKADEGIQKKLSPPLRLLGWNITPGMVLSAAVGIGFLSFMSWGLLFALNIGLGILLEPAAQQAEQSSGLPMVIPFSIMVMSLAVPIAASVYTFYKPIYAAKNKVIRSSGEMILTVLYMVIYMRSSPNLEGAIRFSALNLEGPISKDLKGILWDVEVGKYSRIEESLEDYTKAWKDYNDDFLESLQLLKASVNESNKERRERLLQDAIDRILSTLCCRAFSTGSCKRS